jgi:hypothetical protein
MSEKRTGMTILGFWAVRCPACGAEVGHSCRVIKPAPDGKRRATDIHAARREKWFNTPAEQRA